jgi:hypothetical protein
MLKNPHLNYTRIEEMAEGDEDFKTELIFAVHNSLLDLKTQYLEGATLKDEETLQMIRHKVKPTLSIFDMERLTSTINCGKEIIETQGFGKKFSIHLEQFLAHVNEALEEVCLYMNESKKVE